MAYFVTGATGFIGRHLVARLLERDGDIYVLVREGSSDKLETLIAEKWIPAAGPDSRTRIKPVTGDLTKPRLGLDDATVDELNGAIDHFFHLAAIYDMTADEERNRIANVEGTRHAVELANAVNAGRFHHTSSIAAAGQHKGLFREDMFDEGQKLDHPYHRTKFESEKIARTQTQVPWRVYRPAIVVGNSRTGEMDKIDGPYYFFTAIKLARHYLPGWFPLVGPEFGYTNIVPVDYVAAAMDHIAHEPDLDGQAFHLCNPKRQRSGDVMNEFAKAAHAPQLSMRIDTKLLQALPKGTIGMLMQLPAARGVRKAILADFGIPDEVLGYVSSAARVRHPGYRAGAQGHRHLGAAARELRDQAVGLLGTQPRSRPVQGPQLRGRGQRQDGSHHRRFERDREGGGVQDRARRRHPAARGAQCRQA